MPAECASLKYPFPRHSDDALGDVGPRDVRIDGVSGECSGPRTSVSSVTRISILDLASVCTSCVWGWAIDPLRRATSRSATEPFLIASWMSGMINEKSRGKQASELSQISVGVGAGDAVSRGCTLVQFSVVTLGETGLGDAPGELAREDMMDGGLDVDDTPSPFKFLFFALPK